MEFVLILVSCLLLTTQAASSSDAVLDMDGQELQRGQSYYVRPLFFNGGGLMLASVKNGSCPLNVMLEAIAHKNGRPVMFLPEEPQDDGVVRVGRRLYAMFSGLTVCPESTAWQLDVKGRTDYVTTGGYISDTPGPNFSRFAISKCELARGYVLMSCPCKLCTFPCVSLGVDLVDGRNLLRTGAGTGPLEVVFVKVKGEEAMIQSAVTHPKA